MATYSVSVTLTIDTDPVVISKFGDTNADGLMEDTIAHLVKRADEFLGHGGDVTSSHGSYRQWKKEAQREVH